MGVLPTAAEASYQILSRLQTTLVRVTSNTGVVRTLHYGYHWSSQYLLTGSQFYVDSSFVDDERTKVVHNYEAHSVWRNRFVSWDDYLLASAEHLFQSEPFAIPELFSLESGSKTYDDTNGGALLQSVDNGWDTDHRRLTAVTTSRGSNARAIQNFRYDDWGNQIYVRDDRISGDREELTEQWNAYSGEAPPTNWNVPDLSGEETQSNGEIHDLQKYSVVRDYLPEQAGGGYRDTFRRTIYNSLGLKKVEGLWLDNHWATSGFTYNTVGLAAGSPATQTGPLLGQKTVWDYDFQTHVGNFYSIRKTVQQVIDPTGTNNDIVEETAYDWNSGQKLYSKDGRGYLTEFAYDQLDRLTDTIKPGDEPPLAPGNWNIVHVNGPWEHVAFNDTERTATVFRLPFTTGVGSPLPNPSEKYTYDSLENLTLAEKFNYHDLVGGRFSVLPNVVDSLTRATYTPWGEVASLTDPNENRTRYEYDALGHLAKTIHPDNTHLDVDYDYAQSQRITTNELNVKTLETLDWKEQVQTRVDDFGAANVSSYTYYDGLGLPVVRVNALGQSTVTAYNALNKPVSVVHPALDTWTTAPGSPMPTVFTTTSVNPRETLSYDDAGNQTVRTTGAAGQTRTTSQTYDNLGRAIKTTSGGSVETREEWTWYDPAGNITKMADPLAVAQIKANLLDKAGGTGFVVKTYTSRGQLATESNPMGATVRYRYDWLDRKTQMKDPRASANLAATDRFTVNYAFNDLGRLVQADLPPVLNGARGTVSLSYDLRGNPIQQTDQSGRTTTWSYDSRNRKTRESLTGVDGAGPLVKVWAYDPANNQVSETISDPTSSSGLVTTKVYDHLNRLTETDSPDGQIKKIDYDVLGRITVVRDAAGHLTNNSYDSLGNVTITSDPNGYATHFYYDIWGDQTGRRLQNGNTGDQLFVRIYNDFGQQTYEANNSGQSWRYSYDARGLLSTVEDSNGTRTTNSYDAASRLTGRTLANGARTQYQSWSFDLAGSLRTAIDGNVTTSINQASGSFAADPYDLVNSIDTNVNGHETTLSFGYDNAHEVVQLTYPDNVSVGYQYNGLEQLVSIPGYASAGTYNYMGRLTSLEAANLTKRTNSWGEKSGTLDQFGWGISSKSDRVLVWNNLGDLRYLTKEGSTNEYQYDALNRLTSASERGSFETLSDKSMPNGTVENDVAGLEPVDFSVTNPNVKLDYFATSVGVDLGQSHSVNKVRLVGTSPRIKARNLELYVSTVNQEDTIASDGSRSVWTKVSDATWLQDETGITFQFAAPLQARYLKVHSNWDERDAANEGVADRSSVSGGVAQLIQVSYIVDGQTTVWTYDSAGNRLTQVQQRGSTVTSVYSYYQNSDLVKSVGDWSFVYDKNHNLTGRTNLATGESWAYSWDLLNRLVMVKHKASASSSLSEVASYVYDVRGLKVAQTKQGKTTYYTYDSQGSLIFTDDGTTQIKYIQVQDHPFAEVRKTGDAEPQTFWHSVDHLGSTNVITDKDGKIVWDGDYEAFGSVVRSNGTLDFTPSYTGKQFDVDTGLYYYNARFYDPTLGRFISEDPARDGNNWYAYVANNPINYTDPTGLSYDPVTGTYGTGATLEDDKKNGTGGMTTDGGQKMQDGSGQTVYQAKVEKQKAADVMAEKAHAQAVEIQAPHVTTTGLTFSGYYAGIATSWSFGLAFFSADGGTTVGGYWGYGLGQNLSLSPTGGGLVLPMGGAALDLPATSLAKSLASVQGGYLATTVSVTAPIGLSVTVDQTGKTQVSISGRTTPFQIGESVYGGYTWVSQPWLKW